METDVVVVGAGLAGLRCATALVEAGLDVCIFEAADAVGGRIRTEVVDGFRVDRGFQLLNPAYPAARRWVDLHALDLRSFAPGVAALTDEGRRVRLSHPLRAPGLLPGTALVAARRPREVAALARWAAPLARSLTRSLTRRADVTLGAALDDAGSEGLLRRVVDRFLAGVLLEDEQSTSNLFALLLVRMFLLGVPGVPALGMQALPDQLATPLGARLRLAEPVERLEGSTAVTASGRYAARAVVVATGAAPAAGLLGLAVPALKGVVTTWWDAPSAPSGPALLHVDGRARPGGPVVNCAVVSDAASSYAPVGRRLVQASALLGRDRDLSEAAVRRHAGELLGADPTRWEVIARHEVPDALPIQPPPLSLRRPVALGAGRFVCGDHRDTGSIQGALVSGQRAADAVAATLAAS